MKVKVKTSTADTGRSKQELAAYNASGGHDDNLFHVIAQLAASACDTPIAFVALDDREHCFVKGSYGIKWRTINSSLANVFSQRLSG